MRDGKAKGRHRNGIFHITLEQNPMTQQSKLMIDPGSNGISVVRDDTAGNRTVEYCMIIVTA